MHDANNQVLGGMHWRGMLTSVLAVVDHAMLACSHHAGIGTQVGEHFSRYGDVMDVVLVTDRLSATLADCGRAAHLQQKRAMVLDAAAVRNGGGGWVAARSFTSWVKDCVCSGAGALCTLSNEKLFPVATRQRLGCSGEGCSVPAGFVVAGPGCFSALSIPMRTPHTDSHLPKLEKLDERIAGIAEDIREVAEKPQRVRAAFVTFNSENERRACIKQCPNSEQCCP